MRAGQGLHPWQAAQCGLPGHRRRHSCRSRLGHSFLGLRSLRSRPRSNERPERTKRGHLHLVSCFFKAKGPWDSLRGRRTHHPRGIADATCLPLCCHHQLGTRPAILHGSSLPKSRLDGHRMDGWRIVIADSPAHGLLLNADVAPSFRVLGIKDPNETATSTPTNARSLVAVSLAPRIRPRSPGGRSRQLSSPALKNKRSYRTPKIMLSVRPSETQPEPLTMHDPAHIATSKWPCTSAMSGGKRELLKVCTPGAFCCTSIFHRIVTHPDLPPWSTGQQNRFLECNVNSGVALFGFACLRLAHVREVTLILEIILAANGT